MARKHRRRTRKRNKKGGSVMAKMQEGVQGWKDIGAGKKAKCKTILIDNKYNEKMKFKPNFIVKNFKEIYRIIN